MTKEKKGGQDLVLEGRHLLGVFFLVVILCALFFTLGFVLGRNQSRRQAAAPAASPQPAATEPGRPAAEDLSFYDRVEGKQPPESLPPKSPAGTQTAKQPPAKTAPPTAPIYLQVAALSREADARRLVEDLHKRGFEATVRQSADDRLYRVLTGPYENAELADAAQRRLEAHGFRNILRR